MKNKNNCVDMYIIQGIVTQFICKDAWIYYILANSPFA